MREHEYVILEPGNIRLLRVLRSADGYLHTTTFELIQTPLFDRKGCIYEALSYVWGPQDRPCSLILSDGRQIAITKTLSTALPYVVPTLDTDFLWIDQLCINQADDAEKSAQVPLMAEIFSRAHRTIAWFGEAPHGLLETFRLLPKIAEEAERSHSIPGAHVPATGSHSAHEASNDPAAGPSLQSLVGALSDSDLNLFRFSARFLGLAVEDRLDAAFFARYYMMIRSVTAHLGIVEESTATRARAYVDILRRPLQFFVNHQYCKRVWTVQEAWMSANVDCQVSSLRFPPIVVTICAMLWQVNQLVSGAAVFDTSPNGSSANSHLYYKLYTWLEYFDHRLRLPKKDVFASYLLERRRGLGIGRTQTSNPHDVVYGMLSVPGQHEGRIIPDYAEPVAAVFTSAARYLISANEDLGVLQLCDYGTRSAEANSSYKEQSLPSWVPDFTRLMLVDPLGLMDWHDSIYNACGDARFEPERDRDNATQLRVRGSVLDHIERRLDSWQRSTTVNEQPVIPKGELSERDLGMIRQLYLLFKETVHMASGCLSPNDLVDECRLLRMAAQGQLIRWPDGVDMQDILRIWADPSAADFESRVEADHALLPLNNRAFAKTSGGRLCLAPDAIQPGDAIAILHGSTSPMVLREAGPDPHTYTLLGECYLEGAMFGELEAWVDDEADTFILV